jgi:hypothetical protein
MIARRITVALNVNHFAFYVEEADYLHINRVNVEARHQRVRYPNGKEEQGRIGEFRGENIAIQY